MNYDSDTPILCTSQGWSQKKKFQRAAAPHLCQMGPTVLPKETFFGLTLTFELTFNYGW